MPIAVYFHPKNLTLKQFETRTSGSAKPAPRSRRGAYITRV